MFRKIATMIRPLIDYHLFCVGLWNERTQLLEHSFSMKYGEVIPQSGGFPLGYGLSGTAAALRRPVRVANVLEDPRYVRYRHPEVEIHSELAVPLIAKDQLIGVIDLESTELDYFTEQHEYAVSTLAAYIATALVNARLFERVRRHEQRLERDLATARETQRELLPARPPRVRSLQIGAAYTPAAELGGDFYDFLRPAEGLFAFAVGDVAGKATPAALLASLAVGLLRAHVVEYPRDPGRMLSDLNEHLLSVGGDNRFVAMSFGVYDEPGRTLRLANAGLPRARLLRDGAVEVVAGEGLPLGMLPGASYRVVELALQPGDVLVFCSDGVMESANPRGDGFEETCLAAALTELAGRRAQEFADGLARAVFEFTGTRARQADDYTVVVLECV